MFFHAFSSVVRQMPGYKSQRQSMASTPRLSLYSVHCTTAMGVNPNAVKKINKNNNHNKHNNKQPTAMCSKGTPMTGCMKTEKATSFYSEMKITDRCTFSISWLKHVKETGVAVRSYPHRIHL
jgi:hypothetical protein